MDREALLINLDILKNINPKQTLIRGKMELGLRMSRINPQGTKSLATSALKL